MPMFVIYWFSDSQIGYQIGGCDLSAFSIKIEKPYLCPLKGWGGAGQGRAGHRGGGGIHRIELQPGTKELWFLSLPQVLAFGESRELSAGLPPLQGSLFLICQKIAIGTHLDTEMQWHSCANSVLARWKAFFLLNGLCDSSVILYFF